MTGIYAWYGYDLEPKVALSKIARAGFQATTLWWSDEFFEKEKTLADAREVGLQVVSAHLPYEKMNDIWLSGEKGDVLTVELESLIEDAGRFSVPVLVIHPSEGPSPPAVNDLGLTRFWRLIETATLSGVELALENTRSREHFDRLLQTFPALRICYDSGHNNAVTKDLDLLAPYLERVSALHLHDNDGIKDLHWLPFEGTIKWPAEMEMLSRTGYTGPLMLESISDGSIGPDAYLASAKAILDRLESFLTRS